MATINSTWAQLPIQLTDGLNDSVWSNPGQMAISGGFLLVKNDAQFLYAALDMTGDSGNDAGDGDYFWFTFDRNRDGNITANFDVNYATFPGSPNKLGRQFYLAPSTWTGLSTDSGTCKQIFATSPNLNTAHRIWLFRFSLTDLNVSLVPFWLPPFTRFGIKTHSGNPPQENNTPANFWTSFAALHTLFFSRKPVVDVALQGPVIGCVGLIPTTKIAANGKATTDPGYMVQAQNSAFGGLLNIIGNAPQRVNLWNAGARFIKVFHSEGSGVPPTTDFITGWYNYHWSVPAADYVIDTYGADAMHMYPLQDPAIDFSIHDLLFQFDSSKLTNGIHNFQVKFYNAARVEIPVPVQILKLMIDNTTPIVKINNILHAGTPVMPCDIVKMTSATDGLTINFDANDPAGNMGAWSIIAQWGDGMSAGIDSASYTLALGDWTGVVNHTSPSPGVWMPVMSCAHAFTISASTRNTNGYNRIGYSTVSRFITIMK
jgi:hypothetical protein